jgi:ribonuclease-3
MLGANLSELEETLGFVFDDKSLLQRALTHRSFLNENPDLPWLDNERLEFLGDAILGFVTAEHLYHRFPEMKEGDLTSLRAALVRGQTLAEFATQLNLGPYLLISRGEEAGRGRARPALLAATFEAILGALYFDQGLPAARALIVRMIEDKTQSILQERLDRNAKSLLQELSQGRLKVTPVYRLVETRGPDHAREFTVEALLGSQVYGVGHGRNKQTAEQDAARNAISKLEEEFHTAAEAEARAALDVLLANGEIEASQASPGELNGSAPGVVNS